MSRLGQVLRRRFPALHHRLRRLRHREARLRHRWTSAHGWSVQSGPMAGLQYPENSEIHNLLPRLIGSFESQLHESIEALVALRPPVLINIGSAEGYYAVGLARRLDAMVYAFDELEGEQVRCRELAALNGVAEQVTVGGRIDHQGLAQLPLDGAALVCDCEGDEAELLHDSLLPHLLRTAMLIETHEDHRPGIARALAGHFESSHHIRVISADEATISGNAWPGLEDWSRRDGMDALDEDRSTISGERPQEWIWAVPRETSPA